jgi:G3E family GTPase
VSDSRIPVFVLTGFLGSGKTTLLNALLPHYPGSAVVINELGDIGIDDQLVEEQSVPVTLLAGGCVCCTVRGNLNTTLRNLWMSRRAGSVPAFARLIIETTGAADPWGLVEILSRDSFLARHYRFAAVLTTVDASRGLAGLRAFPEVIEQVLVADTLVMTRADQVTAQSLAEFAAGLGTIIEQIGRQGFQAPGNQARGRIQGCEPRSELGQ